MAECEHGQAFLRAWEAARELARLVREQGHVPLSDVEDCARRHGVDPLAVLRALAVMGFRINYARARVEMYGY